MIKRSFFALTQPKLKYDLIEPTPREVESIPVPDRLILLLNQSLESTKNVLIKKGNRVEKGEKLRLYEKSTEYTVSTVSGFVDTVDAFQDAFGNKGTYIVISNDHKDTSIEYDLEDDIVSADNCLKTLPGAPCLKISTEKDRKVSTIVIMCADPDLCSTTNQYITMRSIDKIKQGVDILRELVNVRNHIVKICIAIPEDFNMQVSFHNIQILRTSKNYPSNLPEMIMKDHFNMTVPAGQSPEDLGVSFVSAEAVVSLTRVYETRKPSFQKILTIVGKKGTRYRVSATIGTPLQKVFNHLNIRINEGDRVVIGGPMKGFSTYNINHPVMPEMDTILVQDKDTLPLLSDYPCVNCGKCIRVCPVNIPVNLLIRYLEARQYEEAADSFDLESCIECGLCSYFCIAKIPLYQYIMLGKNELLKIKTEALMETAK